MAIGTRVVDTDYHLTFRRRCFCGAEYDASDRDGERFGYWGSLQCPACRWPSRGMLDLGIRAVGCPVADPITLHLRRCVWFRDGTTQYVPVEPGTIVL